MRARAWAALAVAGLMALPGAAKADKASDTLRIVWRDAIPNVDPYYNQLRVGLIVATMTFDTLLYRDPTSFALKPLLATEWSWVDPTTLDVTLRQGVRFHNGAAFDAEDVVYTFNLVASPDSKVLTPSNVNWIQSAEKLDQYKVRIHLKKPFPAALEYLALVTPIYPHEYRAKVGPEGMGKAPVGSGPYKIVKVDGVAEIDMVRNDDYFAESPKGRPKIGKLVVRAVPDEATETVELLAGNADWIWNFNSDNFDRINAVPDLTAKRAESMRIGFLGLDAAGRTGPNPLTNLKVRQAVFYAIDRESIAKNLVQGGSRVPPAPCYPTQFGCDDGLAPHYAYNPAKAKALLAEAGFPNGFKTEIVGFRSPQWTAALQSYLRAVGIDANVTMLQVAAAVDKNHRGELQMYHGDWGSFGINDTSAIMGNFFEGSADDQARDPDVKALLETADTAIDTELRKENYRKAIARVMENAYWLPLHTFVTTYAHRKELNFTPYPDEIPRFYLDSWN